MSASLLLTQVKMNNADARNLDLGRCNHFSSHPVHPRHHIRFLATFTHHSRIINSFQRSSLALSLWSAILIPRCNWSPAISTLHRSDTSFQFVRWIFHGRRHKSQMGSLAYTRTLGYYEQYICMLLFDNRRVFQLLANAKAGHSRKHELRCLNDGGNCYLQPVLLSRMGEESVYRTGDRGGLSG